MLIYKSAHLTSRNTPGDLNIIRIMIEDWLRHQAMSSSKKTGLIAENRAWDYRAMHQQVGLLADHLVAIGVSSGMHVAALLTNCPEAVFLVHALARLGAVLVPLNLRHSSLELTWQVDQADCAYLVYNAQTRAAAWQIESARLTRIDLTGWNQPLSLQPKQNPSELDHPTDLLLQAQQRNLVDNYPQTPVGQGLERLQAIVFTSGTSGKPKGAQLTFGNHFYSAVASASRLGIDPQDRWLAVMPLFHVGGRGSFLGLVCMARPWFCKNGSTLTTSYRPLRSTISTWFL